MECQLTSNNNEIVVIFPNTRHDNDNEYFTLLRRLDEVLKEED